MNFIRRFFIRRFFIYCIFFGLLLLPVALTVVSCNTTFGGDYDNTPSGNYDFFFYELRQSYAYKDYTFISGLSRSRMTLSQIQEAERGRLDDSWDSLRDALDLVINVHLRDPHVYSLYSPIPDYGLEDDVIFQNNRGANYDVFFPDVYSDIDWIETSSPYIRYGVITSNPTIGYFYIIDLVDEVGGSDRLSSSSVFGELTDTMVTDFNNRSVERIIVDIRSSAGGAVYRGKEIAGRFISQEKTFMISEYLISPDSYDTVNETITPSGRGELRGLPLVVLVNNNTCSGGEMMVLMFQQTDGYRSTIGTPTRGCTGTISDKELMNGWIVRITSSRTFTPDRVDYFKVGLQPDTFVIQSGASDNVLTEAVNTILTY